MSKKLSIYAEGIVINLAADGAWNVLKSKTCNNKDEFVKWYSGNSVEDNSIVLNKQSVESAISMIFDCPDIKDKVEENNRSVKALHWFQIDENDPMTDIVDHQVLGGTTFRDGTEVQYQILADGTNFLIKIETYRSSKPFNFEYNNNEVEIRIRVDGGEVRFSNIEGKNNEIEIIFCDIEKIKESFEKNGDQNEDQDAPNAGQSRAEAGMSKMLGGFFSASVAISIMQLENTMAGRPVELQRSKSILVELPLEDGSKDIIDINPQDPVFKQFVKSMLQ
jgi:hypothetical protein